MSHPIDRQQVLMPDQLLAALKKLDRWPTISMPAVCEARAAVAEEIESAMAYIDGRYEMDAMFAAIDREFADE
jgi:uncharacterized protein YlxP (DUF503 family)